MTRPAPTVPGVPARPPQTFGDFGDPELAKPVKSPEPPTTDPFSFFDALGDPRERRAWASYLWGRA